MKEPPPPQLSSSVWLMNLIFNYFSMIGSLSVHICFQKTLHLLLIVNTLLHPRPWEVVLSGFVVANHQVSLNSSFAWSGDVCTHYKGEIMWKQRANAVTKLRHSLVKAMRDIEWKTNKIPENNLFERKGSCKSFFSNAAVTWVWFFVSDFCF